MLFNSAEFLLFFPIVTLGWFLLSGRVRVVWMLAASCWFYMAFVPAYLLILGGTIVVDYFAGLIIERAPSRTTKRAWLIASLAANIGVLAFFKYANFLAENIEWLGHLFVPMVHVPRLEWLLPIGLSFHTFQAMSYTIEVYRGKQKAERDFTVYALYVMFYPQLVAGPIERPQNILHQLHARSPFDGLRFGQGIDLMLWGFVKKVAIADRLSPLVDEVYSNPSRHSGLTIALATYAFAVQIYCDFSGYSDIAIGSARVLGIDLMQNFRTPYFATSIVEFWTRWHISLSTWFRDYLYIPLGGNRVARSRWYANLLVVFVVSGLWHGASWTFVMWGALHGMFLIASHATQSLRASLRERTRWFPASVRRTVSIIWVFHLVTFAWIFFRAKDFAAASAVIAGLARGGHALTLTASRGQLALTAVAIVGLVLVEALGTGVRSDDTFTLSRRPLLLWGARYACVATVFFLGEFSSAQFIYFQF